MVAEYSGGVGECGADGGGSRNVAIARSASECDGARARYVGVGAVMSAMRNEYQLMQTSAFIVAMRGYSRIRKLTMQLAVILR